MLKSKIGTHTGAVLSVSVMYMYYLRCKNLPNKNQKQLKWYTFFQLRINPLFRAIKSMAVIFNTDKA